MAAVDDGDLVESDDYYAWLGLSGSASREEINNAFRKMSRMYHPDKHVTEDMKQKAEKLFNKIKKAHEVLADPHKRAVYDTTGIKGLETDGWEVVTRTKTPQEILEEFERLEREKNERRLQQQTNPKGTVNVRVDATDMFDRYDSLSIDNHVLPVIEISEMSVTQSVECPLTVSETATVSGHLNTRNGNGAGSISIALRRVLSHTAWGEVEVSAGNDPALSLRGFRTLWRRGYCTLTGTMQMTPHGHIRPGINFMLAYQLDKNLLGRLTWTAGMHSAMNATLVWDREQHHVVTSVQLGIPNSFAFFHYAYRFTHYDFKLKGTLRLSSYGTLVECGCEKKITQFSNLNASLAVGVPSGVTLKLRVTRGNQLFVFPIHLSEFVTPSPIFYGTVVPLVAYFAIKVLIVKPYVDKQQEREAQMKKEANIQRMAEKQKEAKLAAELMTESVARSYEIEEAKGGLVIRKALYGRLIGTSSELECIDVTVPVQSMVKNSQLVVPAGTQLAELPGFYDPCIGVDKEVNIVYEFHRQLHTVTVSEKDCIMIPKEEHKVSSSSVPRADTSRHSHSTS